MRISVSRRSGMLFLLAVVVIVVDQFTKMLVHRHLPLHVPWNPVDWLRPLVVVTYVRNTGAAFGLFPGLSVFFAGVAIAVILAISLFYRKLAQASWMLSVAFGLQLGGAAGNLIDRLARGYVIDFIDVRVWPVFNVADSALVVGTGLLAYYALFLDRPLGEAAPERGGSEPSDPSAPRSEPDERRGAAAS